jgi:hypothetical protein
LAHNLHILLIGGKRAGIPAATELLRMNKDLIVTIIDSDEYRVPVIKRLNLISETPVFYQPWNNSLITWEGNVYHYDYLFVTPQQNNLPALQQSVLTDKSGAINTDRKTLIHKRYHNIVACGSTSAYVPGGKEHTYFMSVLRKFANTPVRKKFYAGQISAIECAA